MDIDYDDEDSLDPLMGYRAALRDPAPTKQCDLCGLHCSAGLYAANEGRCLEGTPGLCDEGLEYLQTEVYGEAAYNPATDDPPEFQYIGVAVGTHGGVAHVAPDIDPATLAALGQMCDLAYEHFVGGDDDVERLPV
jgi:hypothetical protein